MTRIRKIRTRHYTRSSRAERILDEQILRAGVQNKVFVENARRKLLSPRDAEERYKLAPGKGNAVIEFDVAPMNCSISQIQLLGEKNFILKVMLT